MTTLKTLRLLAALALMTAIPGLSQTAGAPAPAPARPPAEAAKDSAAEDAAFKGRMAKELVNYTVFVQWKDAKGGTNHLQVMTTDGQFSLETLLPEAVKINNQDIPITVSFKGTLNMLTPEKGRLQLFLGRTVPYITGTSYGAPGIQSTSQYQQRQVGLSSTLAAIIGKPMTVQSDGNEEVTVLVKRAEN